MLVSGLPVELLEEILLRLPPDEPGCLFRASAVCEPWRRVVTHSRFASRYRELHRTPPLLGFFENHDAFGCWFASSLPISPFPPIHPDPRNLVVLDCRHGLVLLRTPGWMDEEPVVSLIVWDPVSRRQCEFPPPKFAANILYDNAVVLCSTDRTGFTVVYAGTDGPGTPHASIFSSETRAWSSPAVGTVPDDVEFDEMYPEMWRCGPKALVGNVLYFACVKDFIVRYDLLTRQVSMIDGPLDWRLYSVLMKTDEGVLGCAMIEESELRLYSMETRPDGAVAWRERRSIDLEEHSLKLIGFVDGPDVFYLKADSCIFTVELKSGRVKKIPVNHSSVVADRNRIPYTSFYTPDQAAQGKRDGWEEVSAEKVCDKEEEHREEKAVQKLFDMRSKAIEDRDFVCAIDCLRQVLKIRVAHHGKLSPKCFSTYFQYGRALACETLPNTRYSSKDLNLAWRMLHVARSILEKNPGNTIEKVKIFAALLDVCIHGEDIDYSLIVCFKALAILEHLVEPYHRRIFYLNLQMRFAFKLESYIGDAHAISLCKSCIENLKRANKDLFPDKGDDTSAAEFIEFFTGSLLSALDKKLEDLEQAISSPVSEASGDQNVENDVPRAVSLTSSQFSGASNAMSTAATIGTTDSTSEELEATDRGIERANVKQISYEPSPKKFAVGSPSVEVDSSNSSDAESDGSVSE